MKFAKNKSVDSLLLDLLLKLYFRSSRLGFSKVGFLTDANANDVHVDVVLLTLPHVLVLHYILTFRRTINLQRNNNQGKASKGIF